MVVFAFVQSFFVDSNAYTFPRFAALTAVKMLSEFSQIHAAPNSCCVRVLAHM